MVDRSWNWWLNVAFRKKDARRCFLYINTDSPTESLLVFSAFSAFCVLSELCCLGYGCVTSCSACHPRGFISVTNKEDWSSSKPVAWLRGCHRRGPIAARFLSWGCWIIGFLAPAWQMNLPILAHKVREHSLTSDFEEKSVLQLEWVGLTYMSIVMLFTSYKWKQVATKHLQISHVQTTSEK